MSDDLKGRLRRPVPTVYDAHDAADRIEALEAQVARLKDQIYESIPKWQANDLQQKLDAAEARAKALDEALTEAIEFAEQDAMALTTAGEAMVARWRAALRKEETP